MKFFKRLFESVYKTPFHALQLIPAVLYISISMRLAFPPFHSLPSLFLQISPQ